jgi:16S rRNA (guanine(966)-N(2))-methyltransferase RsmD
VGGLGLEMLSRRASSCVFVEKDRVHAKILQENIRTLNCGTETTVLMEPVEKGGWENLGPFHLVMIDPPYSHSHLPELLQKLAKGEALLPGGIILFEHDPKVVFSDVPGLRLHSHRKLGPAGITVFVR